MTLTFLFYVLITLEGVKFLLLLFIKMGRERFNINSFFTVADEGRKLFRSNSTWWRIFLKGNIKTRLDCPLMTLASGQRTVQHPGLCFPQLSVSFPNHCQEFAHIPRIRGRVGG